MSAKKEGFAKNTAEGLLLPQISDAFGLQRMNHNLHYRNGLPEGILKVKT